MADIIKDSEVKKNNIKEIDSPPTAKEKAESIIKNISAYFRVHKSPGDKRGQRHINPKVLLWVLVIISAALIVCTNFYGSSKTPFKEIASVIIVPAQKGINSVGSWLSEKIKISRTVEELEEENKELQDKLNDLTLSNNLLKQELNELNEFKELLNVKDMYDEYDMEAARVISKSSDKFYTTFTIDKGSADGIETDMNILGKEGGLIGIVTDVGSHFSTVRSIIDDESYVSAILDCNSETCMVKGNTELIEDDLIEFFNVPVSAVISDNTSVFTSSISSKYLPGLLIGYIYSHEKDDNDLTQSGFITPVSDFLHIEEVLVIKKVKELSD